MPSPPDLSRLKARWRAAGLRERLLAYLALFWFLPVVIGVSLILTVQRQNAISSARMQLEGLADSRQAIVQNWRADALEHAAEVAGLVTHCLVTATDVPPHACDLRELLTLETHGEIVETSLLDPATGEVLFSSDPGQEGKIRAGEDYFSAGLAGVSLSEVFYDLALDAPTQAASAPVRDRAGEVVGVIVVRLGVDQLDANIAGAAGLSGAADVYLVNRDGYLLTASRYEAGGILRQAIFSDGAVRALAGESGWAFYDDYRGAPVLGVYRWLPEANMALLAEMERDTVFRGQQAILLTTLSLALVFLLAGSVGALFVSRYVSHPLTEVVVQAARMAAGEFDARVPVRGGGELERLGRAFNEMAAAVQERTDQLTALHETALDIAAHRDMNELLAAITARVTGLLGVAGGGVHILAPDGETLTLIAVHGASEEFLGMQLRRGEGMAGCVLESGQPLIVNNHDRWPGRSGVYPPGMIGSAISAPLLLADRVIGVLSCYETSEAARAFDQDDVRLLEGLARQAAIAIENARLFDAERQQAADMAALADVIAAVNASLEFTQMQEALLRQVARACDAYRATLYLADEATGRILPVASEVADGPRGLGDWDVFQAEAASISLETLPAVQMLLAGGTPVVLDGPEALAVLPRILTESYGVTSLLAVPISYGGQPLGFLTLDHIDSERHFSPRQAELALTIASQLGIAIEKARLFEQERRRARALALLNEARAAITASVDLEVTLDALANNFARVVDATGCSVLLWDADCRKVVLASAYGSYADLYQTLELRPDEPSLARHVIETRRPEVVPDVHNSPLISPRIAALFPDKSLLGLPLFLRGQPVGAVLIGENRRQRHFTQEEVNQAMALAGQAALAIENARLYEHSQQQAEELAAKNAELEAFVYTVSHDLKSPVVTVQGFAGALREDCGHLLPPAGHKSLDFIETAATRMRHLIQDLLELSRIGRISQPLRNIPFDEVVDEAIKLAAPRLEARSVALTMADDFPTVHGDRERLVQALENLLTNAVKFMGEQPEPRIEVGWEGSADGTEGADSSAEGPRFFVRDNGLGVAPEYHTRIFEIFQRLGQVDDPEGTGVGLALVKRVVENHHGRVWVESEGVPGEGSTFYFTLPGA